jgi:predicted transcriptional regulator
MRLKKREPLEIYTAILAILIEEPRGPTRLAQACNINYGRMSGLLAKLLDKGLIRREDTVGQGVFAITEVGYEVYRLWGELRGRMPI